MAVMDNNYTFLECLLSDDYNSGLVSMTGI